MKKELITLAFILLTGLVFFVLALELWMLFSLIYMVYWAIALLLLFSTVVTFLMRKSRLSATHFLLMGVILSANFGAGYVIDKQMEESQQRAEKVIRQLEKYKARHGVLPDKLEDLIPDYVSPPEICPAFGLGLRREPFIYQIYSAQQAGQSERHFRLSFEKGLLTKTTYVSHAKEWVAEK